MEDGARVSSRDALAKLDQYLGMLRQALTHNYRRLDQLLAETAAEGAAKGQATMSELTLTTEGRRTSS
ncbi:MAG: hypothetical protein U0235_00820 [Polyangiaceae bacterium]